VKKLVPDNRIPQGYRLEDMTSEEMMDDFFSDYPNVPNPENYPRVFDWHLQMWVYHKERKLKDEMTNFKRDKYSDGTRW
tara:strand:+ start:6523 stop:6759 length:237 start_codon:yes stop_codon:yes gene_type:complete